MEWQSERVLKYWGRNYIFTGRKHCHNLSASDNEKLISDAFLQVYCDHLDKMLADMTSLFGDPFDLRISNRMSKPLLYT